MAETVVDVLITKLKEDIRVREGAVASGSSKDYSEYKEQCGVLRGLHTALRHIEDLSRAMEDNDD